MPPHTTTAAGKLVFGIFAARGSRRTNLRAHDGLETSAASTGKERRSPVQDDRRETSPGHGGNGAARDRGQQSVNEGTGIPDRPVPATYRQPAKCPDGEAAFGRLITSARCRPAKNAVLADIALIELTMKGSSTMNPLLPATIALWPSSWYPARIYDADTITR